jgi:hypothetical protein
MISFDALKYGSSSNLFKKYFVSLRGVVVDSSGLRDRGPGIKTRSRPFTFTKADTNFVGFSLR